MVSLVRAFLLLPVDFGDAAFVRAPRRRYPADLRMIPGTKVAVPAARTGLLEVSEADNHEQACAGKPYSSQKS